MIRCLKTEFYADKENLDKLFACNRISAMIWNKCLDLAKTYRKEHSGKWISKNHLVKKLKGLYPIHSQSVQAVAERYDDARNSTKAARDKGHNVSYPWRHKHAYPTRWKQAVKINGNHIQLGLGLWNHHQQKPIRLTIPKATAKFLKGKKLLLVDAIWDNRLVLSLCFEDGSKEGKSNGTISAGIDLGEIHSIAASTEDGYAVIVTGRKLRSIHRFRNKKLAEIQRKQAKCTKHSRRWKKLQRAKRYMLRKCDAQVRDTSHKITKAFVDWAVQHRVKHVYCGKVEGVQRNTRKGKKKKRCSHNISQKLANWNFGQITEYLTYKLAKYGIGFEKISEAYTSQTCPVCGQRHKVHGRNYRCSCGYHAHRDVHGSHNILSLGLYGKIQYLGEIKKTKYLRSA